MIVNFCVNIELSVPSAVSFALLQLSSAIKERYPSAVYLVESSGVPPHLTLHYMYLPELKLGQVVQLISKVARNNLTPEIEIGHLEAYRNGILGLPCKGTAALDALHRDLVLTLESIREGSVDPDLKHGLKDRPEFYRRNLRKYGYPYVLEDFRPHIALSRVRNVPFHDLEDLAQRLDETWRPIRFRPDTIDVRTWAESGGVGRTLAQYKLTYSETTGKAEGVD